MKMRCFDFEVFPHWWCCVFGDMPDNLDDINEGLKENFVVVSSTDDHARDRLMEMMYEMASIYRMKMKSGLIISQVISIMADKS